MTWLTYHSQQSTGPRTYMFLISLPGSHVYLAEYIQLILHIITRNIKLIMVQFAQTVTFPHCPSHYDSDFRVQAKRLVLYRPALIVLSHLHSHSLPLTLLQSPWAPTYSLSTPGRFSFETFFFFCFVSSASIPNMWTWLILSHP